MLKIGVVGIGHLGSYHLQKYGILPDNAITGVADRDEERAKKAAVLYRCPAYVDHREMIGTVDAVSIAVPTAAHYSVAKDFLNAGVDVLLEKPITENLSDADDLVAIAEKNHCIFQIGFVERFNPAVIALEKVMGPPLFIEAHRLHPFFERGTDVDVILDLMIHDIDIILHFTQSPLKSVEAVGVPVMSDKIDISNVRLTFESGCVANLTASRISTKTMQKMRFFGVDSYNSVDSEKRELVSLGRIKTPEGKFEIIQNPFEVKMHDSLEEEIRSFLYACLNRQKPAVTGRDGRDALEVATMIMEQMKTL
ncbi:MAG: Gfo/Idh/MocA family oxidoreductase [Deltaproteobacteria bacterium]|nr:Gfo/Idh/MocA family oxidoreductase [Deltaproteobacteria bacterium]